MTETDPLIERLEAEAPRPSPGFRTELRETLDESMGSRSRRPRRSASPMRIRLLVTSYAACGALLMAIAGVGLTGVGPFAS